MIISGLGVMVFNATYKSISVISWQSVLLGEETRVPGENHRPTLLDVCTHGGRLSIVFNKGEMRRFILLTYN
jgi:hypothetical protein